MGNVHPAAPLEVNTQVVSVRIWIDGKAHDVAPERIVSHSPVMLVLRDEENPEELIHYHCHPVEIRSRPTRIVRS